MNAIKTACAAVLIIGVIGGVFVFTPLHADAADVRFQLAELKERVNALREQIKILAYAGAVRPTANFAQHQVVLQVGHWGLEDNEIPWELRGLDPHRQARGGGKVEWEVVLVIAEKTKERLEAQGIGVTLVPAVLPRVYRADAFVSIHADQNPSMPWASGFKVAASSFDQSGKAEQLARIMREEYRKATWLPQERYLPPSMTHYYAFNSNRFMYAIHPETPSVIIETGYLPNPRDRAVIVTNPDMAAEGIANAIMRFLASD